MKLVVLKQHTLTHIDRCSGTSLMIAHVNGDRTNTQLLSSANCCESSSILPSTASGFLVRSDCTCTRKPKRARNLGAPSTHVSPVCFLPVRSALLTPSKRTVITHGWHCNDGFWPEHARVYWVFVSKLCTAVAMHNHTQMLMLIKMTALKIHNSKKSASTVLAKWFCRASRHEDWHQHHSQLTYTAMLHTAAAVQEKVHAHPSYLLTLTLARIWTAMVHVCTHILHMICNGCTQPHEAYTVVADRIFPRPITNPRQIHLGAKVFFPIQLPHFLSNMMKANILRRYRWNDVSVVCDSHALLHIIFIVVSNHFLKNSQDASAAVHQ